MTQDLSTSNDRPKGRIITFYSYKGGVGRSMAVANIAVLLARRGKKVLAIDWDLEAPGLNRFFTSSGLTPAATEGGLIRLLETVSEAGEDPPYKQFLRSTRSSEFPPIDLLTSGEELEDYNKRVGTFSWTEFFSDRRGGHSLEKLRDRWNEDYDFVIIDSRTGITDSGGVCTIQLPDILVFVVGANQQNLDGCKRVISSVHKERSELPFDRSRLLILPLLSRFDGREESSLAKEWLGKCVNAFQPIFDDWLPKECTALDVLERTKLPHVPRYSFGEELSVISERESDPDQLPYYYAATTRILESDFRGVLDVLGKRDDGPDRARALDAAEDPSVAYAAALELARNKDVLGWRKLTQKVASRFPTELLKWQKARSSDLPSSAEGLPQMALDGVSLCAPMMAIALAGVESQHQQFSNQVGLIDEFLNPPSWERSGNTVITRFPEMIVFVYQALLGSVAMQTKQAEIARRLAWTEIPNYSRDGEPMPLVRYSKVTGWPDSLEHICTVAWKFLIQLPDHWVWLNEVFGDVEHYKASVASYYAALNVIEFIDALNQGTDLSKTQGVWPTVPLTFTMMGETVSRRALRLLMENRPVFVELWNSSKLSNEEKIANWRQWEEVMGAWIHNVYKGGVWHWKPFHSDFVRGLAVP